MTESTIILNAGKTRVATLLLEFLYGAWSQSSTAITTGDTTLTGEITATGMARKAMTGTNPTSYVAQMSATWTAGTSYTLHKFALFNASSGGAMLMEYLNTTGITLVSGQSITGTAQVIVSA
jgi:hypothetical protein